MPSVPRYQPMGVEQTRAPQVRVSTESQAGAMGVGIGKPAEAIGQATQEISKIAYEEAIRANQARNKEAENELSKFELAQYKDGGVFRSKEGQAFTAAEKFYKDLEDKKTSLLEGASNEMQKTFISRMYEERKGSMSKAVENHLAAESTKYFMNQYDSGIDLAKSRAEMRYNDPTARVEAYNEIEQSILNKGKLLGWSGDKVAEEMQKNKAEMSYRIAARFVENGRVEEGMSFYKKNNAQFQGKHVETDKLFKDAGESNQADSIAKQIAESTSNMKVAMENLDALGVPDSVKEKALPKIERRIKIKNDNSQSQFDQAVIESITTLNDNPDFDSISLETKNKLNTNIQNELKNYARFKAGTYPKAVANGGIFQKYNTMDMDRLSNVSQQEIVLASKDMTPEEFKAISENWKMAREGINGNDKSKIAFQAKKDDQEYILSKMKDNDLAPRGYKLSSMVSDPEFRASYYAVERQIATQVEKEQAAKGRQLTTEETRKIMDDVMIPKISQEKGMWFWKSEKKIPTASLNPQTYVTKPQEEAYAVLFARSNKLIPPTIKTNEEAIKYLGADTIKELTIDIYKNGPLSSQPRIERAMEIIRKGRGR